MSTSNNICERKVKRNKANNSRKVTLPKSEIDAEEGDSVLIMNLGQDFDKTPGYFQAFLLLKKYPNYFRHTEKKIDPSKAPEIPEFFDQLHEAAQSLDEAIEELDDTFTVLETSEEEKEMRDN